MNAVEVPAGCSSVGLMTRSDAPLSPAAYDFLAEIVYRHSRIRLGPDKQALIAGRLAGRLQAAGVANFDAYCARLRTATADAEIDTLIDLITTNHTHFFREPAHFDLLAREILPLVGRAAVGRPLQVWCAAAASGEEAYSLAIVLAEWARTASDGEWCVHASDISRRMLDRCRLGIYPADRVQLPEVAWLARYFRRGFGEREGCYRVKPTLRRQVFVTRINLFQPEYPLPASLDLIFCRNVMIYFDVESRQELVDRLFAQLAPGGYLFVGHAESLLGLRHALISVRPGVYMRPGGGRRR